MLLYTLRHRLCELEIRSGMNRNHSSFSRSGLNSRKIARQKITSAQKEYKNGLMLDNYPVALCQSRNSKYLLLAGLEMIENGLS